MKSELLNLSQDLIRFKTVEGNDEAFSRAARYVQDYFHGMPGLYVTSFNFEGLPALVISNRPDTKTFDILINGHLDVVPAPNEDFQPTVKNGRLYGRGASDMKTLVAACMLVMKELGETAVTKSVGLMIVFDEETGGFKGTAKLVEAGYRGRVVILPDDMGAFQMTVKEKGMVGVNIHFTGVPAHSCEPWKGKSATDLFLGFASELRRLFPVPQAEAWVTTCNIGPIRSHHPRNQLAAELDVSLDIRYTEDTTSAHIMQQLTDLTTSFNATIKQVFDEPVVLTPLADPLVQDFRHTAEQILGHPVTTTVDHGASDARYFARIGCPVIMFKPPTKGMHGPNESVALDDLATFYKIIKAYCE